MNVNVAREAAALQRLTVPQLRRRYAEVYGETTNAGNRAWLVKRILWRLQALAEGDLSERARQRAQELANDADLRLNPPKDLTLPIPEPTPSAPRPLVQRPHATGAGAHRRFRLRGPGISVALCRGESRHRLPLQRLFVLPRR